jgi:hypothetical protein
LIDNSQRREKKAAKRKKGACPGGVLSNKQRGGMLYGREKIRVMRVVHWQNDVNVEVTCDEI